MKRPIQAVILDVDGVLVGDIPGVTYPDPHPDVITCLRAYKQAGILISLCTAKPSFAIRKIIEDAALSNFHITDGGANVLDPLGGETAVHQSIDQSQIQVVAEYYFQTLNSYIEFYTSSDYFIWEKQRGTKAEKHSKTLERRPKLFENLSEFLSTHEIVKMILITDDENGKSLVEQSFATRFFGLLTLSWSYHPSTLPWQFGIFTAKGVTKKRGVEIIAKKNSIPLADILGVGDTTHDWQFMQLCGYVATLENATIAMKELTRTKGEGHFFIGKHVNQNGIIEILDHFLSDKK